MYWRTVKFVKTKIKPIPPLKTDENTTIVTSKEKASLLAATFQEQNSNINSVNSIHNIDVDQILQIISQPLAHQQIHEISTIDQEEIKSHIKILKPFKAPGTDNKQNILLKHLPDNALKFLKNIFNNCMKLSYFPQACGN